MPVSRSRTFMNWKETAYQVDGEASVSLYEITDVRLNDQEELKQWQADGHVYPTQTVRAASQRSITVMGGDVATLRKIPKGKKFTFSSKLYDSVNGAGPGCMVVTLVGAMVQSVDANGQSNNFATGSVTLVGTSVDGDTDPLTVDIVPATT